MKKLLTPLFTLAILFSMNSMQAQDKVMNYTELQTYLPTSINGYTAGEPTGSTMSMQGMSFSNAEITFTNDHGDEISINLIDYSMAINMFQAATAMWGEGMSFEDDDSKAWSFNWSENIAGWAQIQKNDMEVQLALGIGQRFFLTIDATNKSDIKFVENIAKGMKLEQLAGK